LALPWLPEVVEAQKGQEGRKGLPLLEGIPLSFRKGKISSEIPSDPFCRAARRVNPFQKVSQKVHRRYPETMEKSKKIYLFCVDTTGKLYYYNCRY